MQSFVVGGAVRDQLLGIPVVERDWVVVGATPEEMRAAGFRPVPGGFPVFLHPQSGEEYALARREYKQAPGYRGFRVEYAVDITLEEDLSRRDLTINAMAWGAGGELIDPYGGRDDLRAAVLRHVRAAFVEDPVRLLRIARFAAQLGRWQFRVAPETGSLLRDMTQSGELRYLRPERVWKEMMLALRSRHPWRYFQVLRDCGALSVLLPELALAMEASEDALQPLFRATRRNPDAGFRWAVLMASLIMDRQQADALIARQRPQKAPAALLRKLLQAKSAYRSLGQSPAEQVLLFCERYLDDFRPDGSILLAACECLYPELAAVHASLLDRSCQAVRQIQPRELLRAGFSGARLGAELRDRRMLALKQGLDKG